MSRETFSKPAANPANNNNKLSSSNNLSDNKNNVLLQTATAQISRNFQIPKTETGILYLIVVAKGAT